MQSYSENSRDISVTRSKLIKEVRDQFLQLPLEEKREKYKCSQNFVTLSDIQTWNYYYQLYKLLNKIKINDVRRYKYNPDINEKISIWVGDITRLEIDTIVNAANSSLLGGGGVDGAIHRAAGNYLKAECSTLGGCETGDAKISCGYCLPSKYVIHTVGPVGEQTTKLRNCYEKCLEIKRENNLKSLAFPCISTGIYGYPNDKAAHVALETVRNWLECKDNLKETDRIIFCLFLQNDVDIYHELLQEYFPLSDQEDSKESSNEDE